MGRLTAYIQLVLLALWIMPMNAQQPKVFVNDGQFVDENGDCFVPFGYNYVGSKYVALLEDTWHTDTGWATIMEDFEEMRGYNANTVRIHLQYNKFMDAPDRRNDAAFERLRQLVRVAEANNLYLLVTGLGAYRATDQPEWYEDLNESERWATQAFFWAEVAKNIGFSTAVFAYDLMNEPVQSDTSKWLPGSGFGNFHFVQNLTRTPRGRNFSQIVDAWTGTMTAAIRAYDPITPITVGFIACGNIKDWSSNLDFISTHVYPRPDSASHSGYCDSRLSKAIEFVHNNLDDKPFVYSEIGPLYSFEATDAFMQATCHLVNGWFNHYGGTTLEELTDTVLLDIIRSINLRSFKAKYPEVHRCQSACGDDVAMLEACESDPDLLACYNFNGQWYDGGNLRQDLEDFGTEFGTGFDDRIDAAAVFNNQSFNLPLKYLRAANHPKTRPRHDRSLSIVMKVFPQKASPLATIWAYDDLDESDGDIMWERDFLRLEMVNAGFEDTQSGNHDAFRFRLVYGKGNEMQQETSESVISDCLLYDQWYTVCAIYDTGSDSSFIYVNGRLQHAIRHELTDAWHAMGQYPTIGRLSENAPSNPLLSGAYFGKIDYLKMYNRGLTAGEIKAYTQPLDQADCIKPSHTRHVINPDKIKLVNNPAVGEVRLEGSSLNGRFQVRLIAVTGDVVWMRPMNALSGVLSFSPGNTSPGMYIVHLTAPNGQVIVKKLIIGQ